MDLYLSCDNGISCYFSVRILIYLYVFSPFFIHFSSTLILPVPSFVERRHKKNARVGHVDDKANKLHAIASLRVLLDATKEQAVAANGREPTIEEVHYTAKRFVSLFSGFRFYHRNHMEKQF